MTLPPFMLSLPHFGITLTLTGDFNLLFNPEIDRLSEQ